MGRALTVTNSKSKDVPSAKRRLESFPVNNDEDSRIFEEQKGIMQLRRLVANVNAENLKNPRGGDTERTPGKRISHFVTTDKKRFRKMLKDKKSSDPSRISLRLQSKFKPILDKLDWNFICYVDKTTAYSVFLKIPEKCIPMIFGKGVGKSSRLREVKMFAEGYSPDPGHPHNKLVEEFVKGKGDDSLHLAHDELSMRKLGKCLVFYLDFKDVRGSNMPVFLEGLQTLISKLFEEYSKLALSSPLSEDQKKIYSKYWLQQHLTDEDLIESIYVLSQILSKTTKREIIIIFDHFDDLMKDIRNNFDEDEGMYVFITFSRLCDRSLTKNEYAYKCITSSGYINPLETHLFI